MPSERYFSLKGFNLDSASEYLDPQTARYLKNVVYADTSQTGSVGGSKTGLFKPIEAVEVYDINFSLPAGNNQFAGGFNSSQTNQSFFFNINSNGDHGLYVIEGESRTIQTVYLKNCLNLQLDPSYFIHEGGAWLEIFYYTDPITDLPRQRSYFMWVDGYNDFRFLCIEDSIATNSFDAAQFPYFITPYDPCLLINAGVPTPLDCLTVSEVDNADATLQNSLKFHTWQFRIMAIDVYGRPSEHGIISEAYIPGGNSCLAGSTLLARCLDLTFKVDNLLIDKIQIEFRNCNDLQWYTDTTLNLYIGSNLGDWWTRERNPNIPFNPQTFELTYQFCKDKECNLIDQTETNRTQNPMPRLSQSTAKIGKVMGLGNNKDQFNPLLQDVMKYVSVEVDPPAQDNSGTANIEIYVQIFNPFIRKTQFVWVLDNQGVFGGAYKPATQFTVDNGGYVADLITAYKQNFGSPDQRGFIGYLAGTGSPPVSAVSEQYYVDSSNNFVKVDDYSNFGANPLFFNRNYFQKFTFNSVPKAKYIFRISGQGALLTDKDFYTKSTYIGGLHPWINKSVDYNAFAPYNPKELLVDVCTSDYNSLNETQVLVIIDPTFPGSIGTDRTQVTSGYVFAKTDNLVNEEAIELLAVFANRGSHITPIQSQVTDANGFYWSADSENGYQTAIRGSCGCNNWMDLGAFIVGNIHGLYEHNFIIDNEGRCNGYSGKPCTRSQIKGKITLCGTDIGVPGVGVVLSRGSTAISAADGTFTILAHPDNTAPQLTRVDDLYYMPTVCPFTGCDSVCITPFQITLLPCTDCVENIVIADTVSVQFVVKRGLLSGGNYGVGITLHDWLGRHSFVQTKDDMYVILPTLIQTKTYSPSILKLIIDPSATFPSWVKKITVNVTKELSLDTYIEWIADRVQFIDNSGNENNIAPTQIKIYYASLNEYNVQNNFNTTTHWQFILQSAPSQINYTSDYVEFYVNGDGQFFPTLIRAIIKYDQTGQYFLIDYDTALKDLKQYALMRLCRPSTCVDKDLFYERCISIDVIAGKAQQQKIFIDTFDTYYLYRQIPIPVPVDPDETENVIRTFGFPFEHNSPSDLWGQGCADYGRINSRNPYEAEIVKQNEVALSGGISVNGQLNYLNYFTDSDKKNFDTWDFNGIVAIIPQPGLLLIICQEDCFTVGYNDNILRVDDSGQVIVPSADQKFGNPVTKVGNNYGCSLFDKNTIRSWEGLVHFLDSSKAYLMQHNYSDPKPVSANIVDSWLRPKIKYIQDWNRNNPTQKKYFIATIDPAANNYLLSDFTIGSTEFVNQQRDTDITKQETMAFDIFHKVFRVWWGFTPGGYGMIDNNLLEKQLFSFAKNNIYFHYTTSPTKNYGTIYGEEVEKVIRFVAIIDDFKKKQPLAIANYCVQSKYFADQILTDSDQLSRILLDYFKQGDYFSAAPFLCNLNTLPDENIPDQTGINKILDGDKLIGSIIDIRLIGDPSKNTVFSTYLGSVVSVMGVEQSG